MPPGAEAALPAIQAPSGGLVGLRVLIAEDSPLTRQVFASILSGAGAAVSEAADGRAAVTAVFEAAARGEAFDLAVVDYGMPLMDGVSVTRSLRSGGFRGIVVGLTAGVSVGTSIVWRSCGCDAILPKVLTPAAIVARLAAMASQRRGKPPVKLAPGGGT
jgi:DNA-binding response OmpR family regulator